MKTLFDVADTLSLGDRTMESIERHSSHGRARQQLLIQPSNAKGKLEPTFDYKQPTNITAVVGKNAYLACHVRNLGNRTASFNIHEAFCLHINQSNAPPLLFVIAHRIYYV